MERPKTARPGGRNRWYVVQHHDTFELKESNERPDTQVEKGERMKRAYGPFQTKELAQERLAKLQARALRTKTGRG